MKKKWLIVGNFALVLGLTVLLIIGFQSEPSGMKMTFTFEESYGDLNGKDLSFSAIEGGAYEERVENVGRVVNNQVTFSVKNLDFDDVEWQFTMNSDAGQFAIREFSVIYGGTCILRESGSEWLTRVDFYGNCKCREEDGTVIAAANGEGAYFWVGAGLGKGLGLAARRQNIRRTTGIAAAGYLLYGIVFLFVGGGRPSGRRKRLIPFFVAGTALLLMLGSVAVYGERYLEHNFSDVSVGQLIFHLKAPLEGTNMEVFYGPITEGVLLAAASIGLTIVCSVFMYRWGRGREWLIWASLAGVLCLNWALVAANRHFGIVSYLSYMHKNSTIYESYYVDGRETRLTFPEQKRNLIYIFLESMETTYADRASGGAMDENYIPELTALAMENVDFSGDKGINGAYAVAGATFTVGALVGQTSGVPINEFLVGADLLSESWAKEDMYLPGVWALGDILQEQGYHQVFMVGSDGNFAGRASYFRGHGDYEVMDYGTALWNGWIDPDYYEWWGYEDQKLFSFAKEELLELAGNDQPFNFTMLMVDTHFTGGYVCELCEEEFDEQYSNVIACSDRQVADFVEWITKQDFYENTTIVIAGDHPTMDSEYIKNENAQDFDRKAYFTMINPAEGCRAWERERVYTTLDLYPTTLAGLGVNIEGDRLGLGVNLFSEEPTICEEIGIDEMNTQLQMNSKLYTEQLLYTK